MQYKDRMMDVVVNYLSKTYTHSEVKKMLTVYGPESKREVEKTIDNVLFAVNKLIDEDARRREQNIIERIADAVTTKSNDEDCQ